MNHLNDHANGLFPVFISCVITEKKDYKLKKSVFSKFSADIGIVTPSCFIRDFTLYLIDFQKECDVTEARHPGCARDILVPKLPKILSFESGKRV